MSVRILPPTGYGTFLNEDIDTVSGASAESNKFSNGHPYYAVDLVRGSRLDSPDERTNIQGHSATGQGWPRTVFQRIQMFFSQCCRWASQLKENGVDSRRSFYNLLACFMVHLAAATTSFSSGVLFVAYVDITKKSKELSSWIFFTRTAMPVLAGPIAAYLSRRFSYRTISIIGTLIHVIGTVACYSTLNFTFLLIFFGIISGTGCYLTDILLPALINNSFDKYRSTAMGIYYSSGPVGGLMYPHLIQYFLDNYALQGTFLLLGGVALNSLVGATALFKNDEPKPVPKPEKGHDNPMQVELQTEQDSQHKSSVGNLVEVPDKPSAKEQLIGILKNRGFHLTTFVSFTATFLNQTFMLVLVDYSRMKGQPLSDSLLLLTFNSGSQLVGRLLLSWISDGKFLSRSTFMITTYLVLAVSLMLFPPANDFYLLVFLTCVSGMILGNLLPMSSVILSDYVEKEDMMTAMSIARTVAQCSGLLRSVAIGILCPEGETYDNLFFFLSGLCLLAIILWFAEFILSLTNRTKL